MSNYAYHWAMSDFDQIQLHVGYGDVEITGLESDEVSLELQTGRWPQALCKIDLEGEKRVLRVNVDHVEDQVTLEVPNTKFWQIDVIAGHGDVCVEDLKGALSIQAGNGDINLSNCQGCFDLRCGHGDISMEDCTEESASPCETRRGVWIKNGSGDVDLEGVRASTCQISVGNGDVSLEGGAVESLNLNNSHGDVSCEDILPGGAWKIDLKSGDISLDLPANSAAHIDAATRYGEIESNLPLVRVSRPGPEGRFGKRMVGNTGAITERVAQIDLSTNYGDIEIEGPEPVGQCAPQTGPEAVEVAEPVFVPSPEQAEQREQRQLEVLEMLSRGEVNVEEADLLLRKI
jgi:DUF4097 and DUF4098 domain-containing protein YvlB